MAAITAESLCRLFPKTGHFLQHACDLCYCVGLCSLQLSPHLMSSTLSRACCLRHRCDLGARNFRTMMSYTCPGQNTPQYFLVANPALSINGVPAGNTNNAHCARRLHETRAQVTSVRSPRVGALGPIVSWLAGRRCLDAPTWTSGTQVCLVLNFSFYQERMLIHSRLAPCKL